MSNTNNKTNELEGKETVELFEDLDQSALRTEMFLEKYAKPLGIGFGAILVLILGYFGYQQFISNPKNQEATISLISAQKLLQDGDQDKALGGKSALNPGFLGTLEKYASTEAGQLAGYNAAMIEFQKENYQKAFDLLEDFSSKQPSLMAIKYGAMADCLANLNKNEEAFSFLEKAAKTAKDPYTQYFFTKKAGMFALAINKKEEAKSYFENIEKDFAEYDAGASDAYIEMTKNF